jgi:hypothetical protein
MNDFQNMDQTIIVIRFEISALVVEYFIQGVDIAIHPELISLFAAK